MSENGYLYPVMESETTIMNTLKKLRDAEVIAFDPCFKKQMIWDLIECLYPNDMTEEAKKQMTSLKSNHSKKFDKDTKEPTKAEGVLIHMIWNIFMNGIWWETHGTENREYFDTLSEKGQLQKSIARRLRSVKQEIKRLESENGRIMEEKGLMSKKEFDSYVDDMKQKHNDELDKKYSEDRKAFVALKKRLADSNSDNKMLQEQLRIKVNDVNNRDSHIRELMAQTSANAPAPQ